MDRRRGVTRSGRRRPSAPARDWQVGGGGSAV